MKLRKNEMKLRKNDLKVPKNLPFAPWRISNPSVESPFPWQLSEVGPAWLAAINTRESNSHRMKIVDHPEEAIDKVGITVILVLLFS